MESLNNPRNIVGIGSLIGNSDVPSEKDLDVIEKEIVQGTFALGEKSEINPAQLFEEEMEKLNMNIEQFENKQNKFADNNAYFSGLEHNSPKNVNEVESVQNIRNSNNYINSDRLLFRRLAENF